MLLLLLAAAMPSLSSALGGSDGDDRSGEVGRMGPLLGSGRRHSVRQPPESPHRAVRASALMARQRGSCQ